MRKLIFVLGAFSLMAEVLPSQETLVLKDASGNVLGPVIGVQTTSPGGLNPYVQVQFAYRNGDEIALLRTVNPNTLAAVFPDALPIYYASTNCTGNPILVTNLSGGNIPLVTDLVLVIGSQLWKPDMTSLTSLSVGSVRSMNGHTPGVCNTPQDPVVSGRTLELWGSITFTPPLRVELNPALPE